jgi:iron complex outermembrane receptor protein
MIAGSLAALVGLAGAPRAFAQAEGGAQAAPSGQGAGGLEEIVVTARRREEQLQATPLSITAFSGTKLDQMNINALDDLGKAVPNLSITPGVSYPDSIEISIRGVAEQDTILTNDSPIALYLDGVYIARNNGVPFNFVDLERVEVLRGPQGTLFGRNTTGGAVNIVTKAPSNDFGLSQKIDYASDNEVTLKTVINTGEIGNSGLKAKLTYQHHQMDGYVRNTLTDNPDQWPGADDSDSIYFALRGDITDSFDFDYRFDYTTDSTVLNNFQITTMQPTGLAYYGPGLQVSPSRLGSLAIYPVGPRSTLEALGHALTLEYAVSDALNFKSITAYRSMALNARTSLAGQGELYAFALNPPTYQTGGVERVTPYEVECTGTSEDSCDNQHQYQFSQELQVSGALDSIKYVGGLYYFTEHVGEYDPQFYTFVLNPYVGLNLNAADHYVGKSTSYAAFGQASYTPPILDDRLELTGGMRYTRDEKAVDIFTSSRLLSHRFNALNGDFTANFQWTPDIMTYFRFANAYKAGGFNARDPGPGYQPENADNYEAGVKSDLLDRHLRVNADIFYTQYANQQISSFVANSAAGGAVSTITVNAGQSTYLGGELEVTIIPAHGWQIDTSFGYTDAEFQQYPYTIGGVVTNIANIVKFPYFSKASFNAGFQYTFDPLSFGDLSMRVDFSYKSGEVFHPNPLQSPLNDIIASDALKDLSANITLAHVPLGYGNSELQASVYGRNLINQAWRVQGIDFSAFAPAGFGIDAYNRPRVLGFNLTATY